MALAKDELSKNAMGGSELMKYRLVQELGEEALEGFQIFVSRVHEDLDPNKIKIYWHQDMPEDPSCDILRDKGWQKFDYFVFNSAWQMQMFNLYHGVPYGRSMVLMNAIDPITIPEDKSNDTIRLIYHSTPHRGLELLVPVFEELCKHHNDIELDVYSSFKIYGWEERDKQYADLFERCKEHPKINYYGSVPNEEIKAALSRAHIFAYPNIWRETSCIALMEAMSAGLVCCHPNYGALIDTSGGITRMYQWDEDMNAHATRFYGVVNQAIEDVRSGKTEGETNYVKFYADNRFNWSRRALEWKAFIQMLNAMRARGEMPRPAPTEVFSYSTT